MLVDFKVYEDYYKLDGGVDLVMGDNVWFLDFYGYGGEWCVEK